MKPGRPQETPKDNAATTTTAKPTGEDGEAIEKLDSKVEPEKEAKKPNETMDSDKNGADIIDSI